MVTHRSVEVLCMGLESSSKDSLSEVVPAAIPEHSTAVGISGGDLRVVAGINGPESSLQWVPRLAPRTQLYSCSRTQVYVHCILEV